MQVLGTEPGWPDTTGHVGGSVVVVSLGSGATGPVDELLWSALVAGDPDGLSGLFDRHARAVYNFAFRRSGSWSAAEEVVQATFVTVWRRSVAQTLPGLDHPTALPWLLGVADLESRNQQRSSLRRRRLRDRVHLLEGRPSGADVADEVSSRLDDERRMADLRRAVALLPPHERVVVELVTWAGLTTAEAATTLGVAEGTVKSRMARARNRLVASIAPAHDGGLQ